MNSNLNIESSTPINHTALPKPSQTKLPTVLLFSIIQLFIISGSIYLGTQINNQPRPTPPNTPVIIPEPTINEHTYEIKNLGIKLKIPTNLAIAESASQITISHNIPVINSGSCDMSGGTEEFATLDDFSLSFTLVEKPEIPSYSEPIKLGIIEGVFALEGAEGCGNTIYYFKTPSGKYLVAKRANIQALSGISSAWDLDKILKVPGVITKTENETLFIKILSSIEFISSPTNPSISKSEAIEIKDKIVKAISNKDVNYFLNYLSHRVENCLGWEDTPFLESFKRICGQDKTATIYEIMLWGGEGGPHSVSEMKSLISKSLFNGMQYDHLYLDEKSNFVVTFINGFGSLVLSHSSANIIVAYDPVNAPEITFKKID